MLLGMIIEVVVKASEAEECARRAHELLRELQALRVDVARAAARYDSELAHLDALKHELQP